MGYVNDYLRKLSFLLLFGCCLANGSAQAPAGAERLPDAVLVWLEDGQEISTWCREWNEQSDLSLQAQRRLSARRNIHLLSSSDHRRLPDNLPALLSARSGILAAQWDYEVSNRSTEPNDPYLGDQWPLETIQAPQAWDITTGGATPSGDQIVVAIIDSGYSLDHEDLAERIWINREEAEGQSGVDDDQNGYVDDVHGWNFIDNSPLHPNSAHGTSVSGIIGGQGNNDTGIAGINWNIRLLTLTAKKTSEIVEAYEYVLDQRLRYNASQGAEGAFVVVTNTSLGIDKVFCGELPLWESVYDPLGQAGVLSAGATANGEWDVDEEGDVPTTCGSDYLIAVTNTDRNDLRVFNSGFGAQSIDLGAPGGPADDGAFTTSLNNSYDQSFGGTSAATPHVAGSVALLYSLPYAALDSLAKADPAAAARLVKAAILAGVEPLDDLQGITQTGGRLNLFHSILYLHAMEQEFAVDDPLLEYTQTKDFIRLFPNPLATGDLLQVIYGAPELSPLTFRIYDSLGRELARYEQPTDAFAQQRFQLSTLGLERGLYYLVIDNGKKPIAKGFVVQ